MEKVQTRIQGYFIKHQSERPKLSRDGMRFVWFLQVEKKNEKFLEKK